MGAFLVLEQGSLEELSLGVLGLKFLGDSLEAEVVAMGVEMAEEEDKLMARTPNFSVLSLEEDQEAVTVGGREDKLLGRISQEPGSLVWTLFLVEGTITVVIVPHSTTITTMEGTTVGTTMDTIMVKIPVEMDTTADTIAGNSRGASATTT